MELELESLKELDTWELGPPSNDQKIVQTKCVNAWKKNGQAMLIQNKACLVAKGFSQIPEINFARVYHQF